MMIRLPGSECPTTMLGFGCAALSGGSSRRHSIRLVHAANDAGIRHFDVAPPYGMGSAENVLGEALQGRRHQVTLATKVGIARPRHAWALMPIRSLAAPLRKAVPMLTRRVGASTYTGLTAHARLDTGFVEASLMDSLRRLRTDYLDLLLLHEVTPDLLSDELVAFLQKLHQRGVVRALGTGTSYTSTLSIRARYPAAFDVWQYAWSLLDADQEAPVNFTITHRAIQQGLVPVRNWLQSNAERTRTMSEAMGIDLSQEDDLGRVLIAAAMAHNPGGITLLASRKVSRIVANASLMSDRLFLNAGKSLIQAFTTEPEMAGV